MHRLCPFSRSSGYKKCGRLLWNVHKRFTMALGGAIGAQVRSRITPLSWLISSQSRLLDVHGSRFPRLAGSIAQALILLWDAVRALGSAASTRDVGLHELEKFCSRVQGLLPSSHDAMDVDAEANEHIPLSSIYPNPTREEMYLEARDAFFWRGDHHRCGARAPRQHRACPREASGSRIGA